MAVTSFIYGKFWLSVLNKEVDVDSDSLYVMLCTSTYSPNQDTHQYKSSVTDEIAGTGYTANGQALSGVTVTYTAGTNVTMIDCNDPSWASSTLTARYAVYYDRTPSTDATRPVMVLQNFGSDQTTNNGTFGITINAAGLLTITTGVEA